MIQRLRLQHFRSYSDASFDLGPGVNIVVGPNASGKTNLLEALLVLARGSSYRAVDSELVEFNQEWSRLDAFGDEQRTIKIVKAGGRASKTYEIGGKAYGRLTLNHTLPVVLFEPNHLQLFVAGPEGRRTYLDDLLEQTLPGYATLRRQYRRTLAQRNKLLKQSHSPNASQIFPWNIRLSQLAGQVVRARSELVGRLNQPLPSLYNELSKTATKTSADYVSQWPAEAYESHLLKKLDASLADDLARGFTGSGPHRDDLNVLLDGHLSQLAASRGEMRTAVLALKLVELQLLETARDQKPLLLLDDVFSELDGGRRRALAEHVVGYQTFITTTDADTTAISAAYKIIKIQPDAQG